MNWTVQLLADNLGEFRPAEAQDFLSNEPSSGSIAFAPGQTEATVRVGIAGDTNPEWNEYFKVVVCSGGR